MYRLAVLLGWITAFRRERSYWDPKSTDLLANGSRLREFVLWLFVAGAAASAIDLVVLGHFEDLKQWVPLVLLPASLLVVAWHRLRPGCRGLRALQGIMALFIASGVVGLWFHCSGNMAFELEIAPTTAGWELLRETLSGAIPALAPALMVQLGLLGLIYTYRHPLLEHGPTRSGGIGKQEEV